MIGVDIGGTNIKVAEVDGGEIRKTDSVSTPPGSTPDVVLDTIADAIGRFGKPESVGVAIPGEVDGDGKVWRLPNVPGFEGVPFASELARRLNAKVVIENDGTAAALAELEFGHGRKHPSFVMVTLGTGIGGGLAVDGRVVRGANGFAGEVGHIMIDSSPEAWPCACGRIGCVESYAGTAGLLRRFEQLGKRATDIAQVAQSARAGEPEGKQVFEGMGVALSKLVTAVQNLLDLDAIIFTGGVSKSFDLVEPSLRSSMRERAYGKPLAEVPLLVSELGDRAGAVGAAHLPRVFGG